jgi:dolichol-phosphate mannosyltransferase
LIDEIVNVIGQNEFEVIVVDDNSPDKTWQVVEDKAKKDNRIRLLRRLDKKGLTSALNDGITMSLGEVVVWMDSDFQMPPSKIPELLEALENGYDVAVGSRFIKGGSDHRYDKALHHRKIVDIHRILSRLICWVTSIIFLTNHKDWTSGFIAIKRNIFDHVELQGNYGEYFMYLLHYVIKSGYKVIEIPYVLAPRHKGDSKTTKSYNSLIIKGVKYFSDVVLIAVRKKYK